MSEWMDTKGCDSVRVVLVDSNALYFSRAMLPHNKSGKFTPGTTSYLRHVGMYAFRKDFLLEFPSLPPSDLETSEYLEQLRVLFAGYKIRLVSVDSTLPGVDTPAERPRHEVRVTVVQCKWRYQSRARNIYIYV